MKSLKQKVLKNTLWGGLEAVIEFVVPTVVGVLVARAMGPTKLGAWGYVLWLALMARVLGDFGLPHAVRRYVAQYFGEKRFAIGLVILRRALLFQFLVGCALTLGGLYWANNFLPEDQRVFASIAVVSILPAAVMGIATGVNDAMEQLRANVVPSVIGVLAQAVLSLLTLVFGWDLEGLAVALLVGRILDSVIRWYFVRRLLRRYLVEEGGEGISLDAREVIPPDLWRDILLFCVNASVLLALRMIVWMRSEVFFLERFCTFEQLAFYSVAIGFSELPVRLAGPFTRAAVASLFAERGRSIEGARRFARLFWRYQSLIVFPASAGLCVLSGPLIRVLYGPEYYPAAPVLMWALALGFLAPLAEPAINLMTAADGQGHLVRWNLVAAVVVIGLDIVLVQRYCALGGAVAMGVGRTFTTLGVWVIASRGFGFVLPYRFALKLAGATLAMVLATWLVTYWGPDLLALFTGPPVGVIAFSLALRFVGVLEAEDVERLQSAQSMVPGRFRSQFRSFLSWLSPSAAR